MKQEAPGSEKKSLLSRLARAAGTLAALAVLWWLVDWQTFAATLRSASPLWLLAALVTMIADRILMSVKWQILLVASGARIPFLANLRIYTAAQLAAFVMPLEIAADGLRVLWVSRLGRRASAVSASIVVERGVALLVSMAFSAVAALALALQLVEADLALAASFVLAGMLALPLLHVAARRSGLLRPLLRRLAASRLRRPMVMLRRILSGRKALVRATLLTAMRQLVVVAANCMLAWAVGLPVHPLLFATAFLCALLIARIPISYGGLGVFETSLAMLLTPFGVPPSATVATALAGRVLTILSLLPGASLPGAARRLPRRATQRNRRLAGASSH
ncbi:lysylphosphatidylglycerol synthase transmembrane domain-containing protein [Geminicoccaceae bacterium 1502E]|nr:lysylphosphatidylglycerol synthase transmembrane domain-containing protein [Geminicoccaceae bacterium 1502E]